ncbi:MAG: formate--tetrahydrofolate ligase [Thermoanaerobaculia bacterium]
MQQPLDLQPIKAIADKLDIADEYLVPYGRYQAKIDLELLEDPRYTRNGKMILVTAMTPMSTGEGKTVTSIGLAQGLTRIGKRAVVTLREPSLGPVFGVKGGATGAGQSQVLPALSINLHFNGDIHAVTAAHNLLAAMIDAHLFHGNEMKLAIDGIYWPRALDMNDRALRHLVIGLGGKANGIPRETGFVITAASEIMAILALAESRDDLRQRLSNVVVGTTTDGKLVRAGDLNATGALMVLLNEAIMPNLVQTTEGTPAFVHAGPFANIAHGTSSVLAQRMALRLADYVVNETGFAADLGAEKYFDIVMRQSGIKPSAAVVIVTAKALRHHGAVKGQDSDPEALQRGFVNLAKHLDNLKKFGVASVVAINRFPSDTEEDLTAIRAWCNARGVPVALSEVFEKGGEGATDLAEKVVAATEATVLNNVHPLYELDATYEQKIETIATEIYGASEVYYEGGARKKMKQYAMQGHGNLPVCVAKTQSSLSDDPKLLGAPKDWTLTITDATVSAGAGFMVVIAGNMMLMPGLPKTPAAFHMDVNEEDEIVGLA